MQWDQYQERGNLAEVEELQYGALPRDCINLKNFILKQFWIIHVFPTIYINS